MTHLLNNLKNRLIYSKTLPKIYTFFTKPFSTKLRHLTKTSNPLPTHPEKISVIVPNYNYARRLPDRINTIVNQTYPISELIILDDKSTDESDAVIKKIIEELKISHKKLRIIYQRNEKNSGSPILQWKKGISLASGDYFWIAEADDLSDPRFLEKIMPKFSDKDVILSYSDSVAINDDGKILHYHFSSRAGKYVKAHFKKSFTNDGQKEREICLNRRCTIPNVSAVVFRKKETILFEQYLTEASKFSQVGDWYFYLKLMRHGKISFTRESLNFFRIHKGSVTKETNKNKHEDEIAYIHSHQDMI